MSWFPWILSLLLQVQVAILLSAVSTDIACGLFGKLKLLFVVLNSIFLLSLNFLFCFGNFLQRTQVLFVESLIPLFWTSKPGWIPHLQFSYLHEADSSGSTSGATPTDLLVASMTGQFHSLHAFSRGRILGLDLETLHTDSRRAIHSTTATDYSVIEL